MGASPSCVRGSECKPRGMPCSATQARLPAKATKAAKRPACPVLSSLASYTYAPSVSQSTAAATRRPGPLTPQYTTHHGPPAAQSHTHTHTHTYALFGSHGVPCVCTGVCVGAVGMWFV